MYKAWVGIRDFEGHLLGVSLLDAHMSGINEAVEVRVKNKLCIASLDRKIEQNISVYSVVLEEGIVPPEFDLVFIGQCPSGHLAFKMTDQKIVRLGRDNSIIPVPKLDLPDKIKGKSDWKEIRPGMFQKM